MSGAAIICALSVRAPAWRAMAGAAMPMTPTEAAT
jgi:hypothetical protein